MITFVRAIVASIAFGLILLATYYVHIAFFTVDVIFYGSILDVLIATVFAAILLYTLPFFRILTRLERAQLVAIWLLGGYGLAISVPTVIDRSLSFYILEKLQQRGGGIQLSRMADVFTEEYMHEYRLVDIRLTEQEQSGTIIIENGCVKLTPKGERVASMGQFFRRHFLPKNRLLRGEYTDVLTDPFRNSPKIGDYTCQ